MDPLAHAVTNQTEAAYARSDLFERRRQLMDEWAAYLGGERGQEVRVTSRGHEPRTLYGRRSTTPREPRTV